MNDTSAFQLKNPDKSNFSSGLYIVPTPIGNLRDITLRALDVFVACDVIVCEDSRVTGKLLKAYAIGAKKKIVYNDHADDETKHYILSLIDQGKVIALVSDAGTPLISDPGYKLARDAIANGHYVTALPGANAVLPALQLSGLPSDIFTFAGFLPSKDKGVKDMVSRYARRNETIVFYESPKRLAKTLSIMAEIMPDRKIAIVREISKLYEQAITMIAKDMAAYINKNPVKGEISIVMEGVHDQMDETFDLDTEIKKALMKGQSVKDIATDLSVISGLKKKDIYNRALEIKQD